VRSYKTFFNKDFVHSHELVDKQDKPADRTATITAVEDEGLIMEGGVENDKMVIQFEETKKKFICNKTNAKLIASSLGTEDVDEWIGKKITLFSDRCKLKGEMVDCIRIRAPKSSKDSSRASQEETDNLLNKDKP